jgi:sugar-specific transcriptional regulator TrmB
MDLIQALKNLGLNEKEARVYIALLQAGRATAYTVAKHSGLKKPTTYVILEDLIDKGIVSKVPRAKVAQYAAISPDDLFSMAKSRIANAEKEALPELKALSWGKKYKVKVSYYEGLAGVREMYNLIFKEMAGKEYVGFYAHGRDASPELLKLFDELNEKTRQLKIKRRGITVYHRTIIQRYLKNDFLKKYRVKLKALPIELYDSNISIEMFKNYTMIFSHRHLQGVIIDNPDVAKVMRQIFELIWNRKNIFKFES